MVILGISIGTRSSGIAILDNGELTAWSTLSFRGGWSETKADRIIRRYEGYIKTHRVKVVILKLPPISHQTDAILNLLNRLRDLIGLHGCMVEYKTKAEIKKVIPKARNTRDIMSYATERYPILMLEQSQELANKNRYHNKMFEAVVVAHVFESANQVGRGNIYH